MHVVGGVVPVDVAGKPFVGLALLMGVAVLGDRGRELRVPEDLGLCHRVSVMTRGDVGGRQRHADRHRDGDDEAEQGPDAAAGHDGHL